MPAERNIVASKPFNGVIETEKVAVSPTVRIWELGDAAIEKDCLIAVRRNNSSDIRLGHVL